MILSPVGPYFPEGLVPLKMFVEEGSVRAPPGGTGSFKIGGNYASTLFHQEAARRNHDCAQVACLTRPPSLPS